MPGNTVFIVDDDAAVRKGLKFLLSSAGYGAEMFSTAQLFLETYDPRRGGCLLLDVQMPSMTGPDLQREINLRGWRVPVIFITGHATVPLAIEAIKAGAFDLIEKPLQEETLLDCVRRALGETVAARDERLAQVQLKTRADLLTPREREVLTLLAAGEPSKAIARQLGISFRTVEAHRASISHKLQARGPADLIRLASLVNSMPPMA